MPTVDHDCLARAQLNEDGISMGLMSGESLNRANDTDALSYLERTTLYKLLRAELNDRNSNDTYPLGDPNYDIFAAARKSTDALEKLHQTSLAHVAALARIADEQNIPFVLIHVLLAHQVADDEWRGGRSAYQFEERNYDAPEAPIIEKFCAAQKIQCVMTTPMFQKLAAERSSRVYFQYHHVLTEVGHRALVGMLLETMHSIVKAPEDPSQLSSTF